MRTQLLRSNDIREARDAPTHTKGTVSSRSAAGSYACYGKANKKAHLIANDEHLLRC